VGKTYTFSAYVKRIEGNSGNVSLSIGGDSFKSEPVELISINDWQRLELTFTASGENLQTNVKVNGSTGGYTLLIDGIQIESGEKASDFDEEIMPKGYIDNVSNISENQFVNLLLYVFSNHKKEVPGWSIQYAGRVSSSTIEKLAMDDKGDPWIKADKKMYLTKLTRSMNQSEMTSDVYLRDSQDNNPVGGGSMIDFGNFGLGVGLRILLVFGIPLTLEIVIIMMVWKKRYSKSKLEKKV
jgi:hypothetical protein